MCMCEIIKINTLFNVKKHRERSLDSYIKLRINKRMESLIFAVRCDEQTFYFKPSSSEQLMIDSGLELMTYVRHCK